MILQKLEQAGAFLVALDARRSWFRYHRLFADLLELELRRTEPTELAAPARRGGRLVCRAQVPGGGGPPRPGGARLGRASRLLADHWLDVTLNGQAVTAHQLVSSFPADAVTANAELTAAAAATRR